MYCTGLVLLVVNRAVFGATTEVSEQTVKQDPVAVNNLIQLTLGMLVVLAVIMGLAWLAKRSGKFQFGAAGALRLLGGISVGGRERVVLLQVGEEQILIGVTPGSVRALHVLDKPISEMEAVSPSTQTFSEQLSHYIKRGKPS